MRIKVLEDNQIEKMRKLTEDVIENTGFKVENENPLRKAAKAGAKVDEANNTIKIPAGLLNELLSQIPHKYNIKGLGDSEYIIGGEQQYIFATVTDPWIIDYETLTLRRPCIEDVRKNTILAQINNQVAITSRMDFPVTDFDGPTSSLRALEIHLLNHIKHYAVYASSLENFNLWMELGQILTQGGDLAKSRLMSIAVPVVSPLTLTKINVEYLLGAVRNNFAVIPTICPMAGTTSPYSREATLLQSNIENIFLAALTQLIKPGNPYLYALGPSVSNMKTGHDLYYTIDKVLWKIGGAELAKAYGIPFSSECGGTLSHRYDMQSGAESMLFILAAQNSGSHLLAGVGSCCNANGLSSEMILIQSSWLKTAEYLYKGMSMEHLEEGVESIKNQGYGGNFLIDDLTLKLLRSGEFFADDLFDMSGCYEPAPSMLEKAHRKVEELTAGYKSPVPEKIQDDLRRFFHDMYKKAGN